MDDVKSRIRAKPSDETFAWVCEAVGAGARIDSWMVAQGGSACAIHAIDVVDAGGGRHPLILKRFFRQEWLAEDPSAGACDLPAVLMTRLPGRAVLLPDDLDGWLREVAEPLVLLHAIADPCARHLEPYRHYGDPHAVPRPPWTKRPDVWETVATRLADAAPPHESGFVHRDYHPTNLLWLQGRVSAVLDFMDSSYGPREVDLAHCRINLAQLHGPDAADRFLEIYGELRGEGFAMHPHWDLVGFLNVLPGPRGVYWGWTNLGVRHLTDALCGSRLDEHAARVVARLA